MGATATVTVEEEEAPACAQNHNQHLNNSVAFSATESQSQRPQRKRRPPSRYIVEEEDCAFSSARRPSTRKKVLVSKHSLRRRHGHMQNPQQQQQQRQQENEKQQQQKQQSPQPQLPAMTTYERLRENTIRRNNAFLSSLGIIVAPEPKPKSPKPTPKKTLALAASTATAPLRRSARKKEKSELNSAPAETGHGLAGAGGGIYRYEVSDDCVNGDRGGIIYRCEVSDECVNGVGEEDFTIMELRRAGTVLQEPHGGGHVNAMDVAACDSGRSVLLAAAGNSGTVSIFDACSSERSEPLLAWQACSCRISGLRILDGVRVLTASSDGRLLLWDVGRQGSRSGVPERLASAQNVNYGSILAMAEMQARIAATSRNSAVSFCRLGPYGFQLERSFCGHHSGAVRGVGFRDYDTAADCGSDGKICVLDLRQHNMCSVFIDSGHGSNVNTVDWCPWQEHLLMSSSLDPEILVHDVRNPKQALYSLAGHVNSKVLRCYQMYKPAFIKDGSIVASTGQGSKLVSLYSMKNGAAISRGYMGFNANMVMCKSSSAAMDSSSTAKALSLSHSHRVWVAGKQICQFLAVSKTNSSMLLH